MLWSGIKSIVNVKKNSNTSHMSHLLTNDSCVSDPTKMDNTFSQYFENVGTEVGKSIPRTKKLPLSYLKNRNSDLLFLAPVTSNEIEIITH